MAEAALRKPPFAASNRAVTRRPTSTWISRSISSTSKSRFPFSPVRREVERWPLTGIRVPRLCYKLANLELTRSVISIEPGAWVMQNSGLTWAMTACGVTPQAQNTGSSSASTGTASP